MTLLCAPCSLLAQVAVAAGVPVSGVAMRRQDARSVLTAASVSFAAGEGGLEAAVRFVQALNGSSTSLLLEPPLAFHNVSAGSISIAEIGILGVRSLLLGHAPTHQGIAPCLPLHARGFYLNSSHSLLAGCDGLPARCAMCFLCAIELRTLNNLRTQA